MADSELDIAVRLSDEFSAGMNTIQQNLNGFGKGVADIGLTVTTFGQQLRTASREIGNMGSVFALWGVAGVAPFALALKNSEASVNSVGNAMEQLTDIAQEFQESIATSVVPVIQNFTKSLNGVYQWFIALPQGMRDSITQGLLLASAMTLLTGVVIKIGAEIGKVVSDVALLAGHFLEFLGPILELNPVLVATVGIIAVVITAVGGWNEAMKILINTLQLVWESINSGVHASIIAFVGLAEIVVDTEEAITKALALIPGATQKMYQDSVAWWDSLRVKLQDMANNQIPAISNSAKNMGTILAGQTGTWSLALDDAKKHAQDFFTAWQNGSNVAITSSKTFQGELTATVKYFGDLGTALTTYAGQNKAYAEAAKVVSIGTAIMNGAEGVTSIWAKWGWNPPIAAAFTALEAAAVGFQIATIESQSFDVGTPNVPQDMMAQIHQGEAIIPASFADAIRSGQLSLSGGNSASSGSNGGVTVNVYYPKMSSKSEVQSLSNALGLEIQRQLRYAI